jgi:hypothetical protein
MAFSSGRHPALTYWFARDFFEPVPGLDQVHGPGSSPGQSFFVITDTGSGSFFLIVTNQLQTKIRIAPYGRSPRTLRTLA